MPQKKKPMPRKVKDDERAKKPKAPTKKAPELSEKDLDKVSGGLDPTGLPPGINSANIIVY